MVPAPARLATRPMRGIRDRAASTDSCSSRARAVYLDGTQSAWLGVGEAAKRLVQAGVAAGTGFLNASNYQATARLRQYGTWVSKCICVRDERARLGGRALRLVREPVLSRDFQRLLDMAPDRRVSTRRRSIRTSPASSSRTSWSTRAATARGRGSRRCRPGPAGLVQPAGPRARCAADGDHRCGAGVGPADRRCVPLGEGPR